MHVVFRTDDVPVADRLAFYQDAVSRTLVPIEVRGDPSDNFRVSMEATEIGGVSLAVMNSADRSRLEFRRTPKLIRRCDPEAYRLVLSARGRTELGQDERQAVLVAG